ncbi:bactericidal permeability-increasing protein-like [Sminthopsis crassicaudata]|uniref:bactericidal permeability-increasing protein-like n=1 Tax=Sminthopsis crassicaudata TaxID=9301 RepID=UPI003D699254
MTVLESCQRQYTLVQNAPRAQRHPKSRMPQKMWVRLILMAAMGVALEGNENPGVVIRLTQKGLNHVSKEGAVLLQKELMKINLPIQLGIGKHELIRMAFTKFLLPRSRVLMMPEGPKLSLTNVLIHITGKWSNDKYNKEHIPFDLRLDGVSISVTFYLGKNDKGHITISVSSCNIHINYVNIFSSTDQSLLRDLYKQNFQAVLQNDINEKICRVICNATTSYMEPYLQTMPVIVQVDEIAGIDYSPMKPPQISNHNLEIPLKGNFFSLIHQESHPYQPQIMNFHGSQIQMIFFAVSHTVFDSAKHVYQDAGIKSLHVTNSKLSKDSKFPLTTNYYGTLIPKLSQKFLNMEMKIEVGLPPLPTVVYNSRQKMSLTSVLSAHVYAISSNSSHNLLFTLSLDTSVTLHIYVKNGTILGRLSLESIEIKLKHSNVGYFQESVLKDAFIHYMNEVWIPRVNWRLEKGYPLPIPVDLHFFNYIVYPHKNFLVFGSDFNHF